MTFDEFTSTLAGNAPPAALASPLAALWWAKKNDWDKAHAIVMDEESPAAAWVHAYLHRVEGDLPNARYWYRQAKRPEAKGALEAEWADMVTALLQRS